MRTTLPAAIIAGAVAALLAGSAQGAVIIGSVTTSTPYSGIPGTINFDGGFKDAPPGFTWTGGGQVMNTTNSQGAEPLGDKSPYLSVLGGQTATLTVNTGITGGALSSLKLFIGSVDNYNSITFHAGAASQTIFGNTLLNDIMPGDTDSGDQKSSLANAYFTFHFLMAVDQIVFRSGQNSLEVDDLTPTVAVGSEGGGGFVPEPAIWVVMLAGFGLLGLALRARTMNVFAGFQRT
jgi:hypothetical protein